MSTRIGLALGVALLCCTVLVTPGVSATYGRHHARRVVSKSAARSGSEPTRMDARPAPWVSPFAGWDYAGYAAADGVPLAIVQDRASAQGLLLSVGTQAFGGTVTEITRDHVRLVFGPHFQELPRYNGRRFAQPNPLAPAVPIQPLLAGAAPVQDAVQLDQSAAADPPLFQPLTADQRQQARDAWRAVRDGDLAQATQPTPTEQPRAHSYVPPAASG